MVSTGLASDGVRKTCMMNSCPAPTVKIAVALTGLSIYCSVSPSCVIKKQLHCAEHSSLNYKFLNLIRILKSPDFPGNRNPN